MTELDRLGKRHAKLQEELRDVRAQLAPLIRAEHAEAGATHAELMVRSGYKSIETIRQILNPKARAGINAKRRGEAASNGQVRDSD